MTAAARPIPNRLEPAQQCSEPPRPVPTLDLRGVPCPLNLVKAKLAIEKIAVGDILEIAIDEGEPIRNLPVSLSRQGQEIVETTRQQSYFCLKIRRKL
jgi:TusA-related sulfurtransferase